MSAPAYGPGEVGYDAPVPFLEADNECLQNHGQAFIVPSNQLRDRYVPSPGIWYLNSAGATSIMPLINLSFETKCYIGTANTMLRMVIKNSSVGADGLLAVPTFGTVTKVDIRINPLNGPPRHVETVVVDTRKLGSLKAYDNDQFKLPDLGSLSEPMSGLFRLPIKDIPTGALVYVNVAILENLDYSEGRYILNQKLEFANETLPRVDVNRVIRVQGQVAGFASVQLYSTSHQLQVTAYPSYLLFNAVCLAATSVNFNLGASYTSDLISGTLVNQVAGVDEQNRESGHFVLFVTPPTQAPGAKFHRAVVFIVDKSGSMAGRPWNEAVRALKFALGMLGPADWFNIMCFDATVDTWSVHGMRQADQVALANANSWLDMQAPRRGLTDIQTPLNMAISQLAMLRNHVPMVSQTHVSSIFLITDGAVDNEQEICNTVMQPVKDYDIRLLAFGLGTYCNWYFLQRLAEISRGHSHLCVYSQELYPQVVGLWRRASSPLLVNVHVNIPGLELCQIFPNPIPDLGHETPLLVSGRYLTKPGNRFPRELSMGGSYPNQQPLTLPLITASSEDIPVDKVTALQQIDLLSSRYWLSNNESQLEAAIEMSCQHNIASKHATMVGYEVDPDARSRFERDSMKDRKRQKDARAADSQYAKAAALAVGGVFVLGAALVLTGNVPATVSNATSFPSFHMSGGSGGGCQTCLDCFYCCDVVCNCMGHCLDCTSSFCECGNICNLLGDCLGSMCSVCDCLGSVCGALAGCDCNC